MNQTFENRGKKTSNIRATIVRILESTDSTETLGGIAIQFIRHHLLKAGERKKTLKKKEARKSAEQRERERERRKEITQNVYGLERKKKRERERERERMLLGRLMEEAHSFWESGRRHRAGPPPLRQSGGGRSSASAGGPRPLALFI